MGGFSYGIPLAVTPEQIAAAVEQRGGTYTPPTLTQTVTATPAPSVPANATGIAAQELTGNPDMDRQILAARDAQGVSVDVGAGSLTPEEYQQGIEELGAWRNLPENSAWRDTRRLDISPADLLQVAATFAIPIAAPAVAGALAGATGVAGLGGTVGTTLTQAALSGGLAAATGGDPLQGALSGALLPNPTQLSAGQNLFNLAQRTADAVDTRDTPSVIEQVFSDADYRAGGVIPEQPFETRAPIIEPTEQQRGGGGGASAAAPGEPVAPDATVEELVDFIGGGVLADTTAPELPEPAPTPTLPPAPTQPVSDAAQPEPAPDYTGAINNILTQVDEYRQEGQTSTQAVQTAVDEVAEDLNVTREDLLGQLGATEESILTEVNERTDELTGSIEGLQGGVTRNEELIGAVNDRLDEYVQQGESRSDALEQAVADVAAQTDQSFMDVLGYLGDLRESVDVDIESARTEGASGRQQILDQVVANEAAGMERDEALDEAIANVSDSLGVAVEDLLGQMGTNRTELEGAISTLEEQVADVQSSVEQQVEDAQASVLEQVAANEQAGMARDEAINQAVEQVAGNLGTTRQELLDQLGTTESNILEQVAEGVAAGEARDEALGEGLGELGEGLMSLQAQSRARAFQPKWTELFKYTTLTPYQKKAMTPFVDYIAQARGMLS